MKTNIMQHGQVFYIAALFAGALVTRYIRMHGTIEEVTERMHNALSEADSITVECIGDNMPQDNPRINRGYDAACNKDDLPVYC